MKRKCNALLALLLAVCMIVPMGVFTGAAGSSDDAEAITAVITGAIDQTTGKTISSDKVNTGDICLAVGGSVTVAISVPTGYTLDRPEVGYNGGFSLSQSGNTITITGQNEATNTVTLTAKSADEGKTDLSLTLTFHVLKKIIIEDTVTVSLNGSELSRENKNTFTPGTVINKNDFTVTWQYSDQKPAQTIKGEVTISTDTSSMTDKGNLTIKGGDSKLNFSIVSNDGYSYSYSYPVVVTGKTITNVNLTPKTGNALTKYAEGTTVTPEMVKNNILIYVTYQGEDPVEIYNDYALTFVNTETAKESGSLSISISDCGKYQVYVTYDGVKSKAVALSSIIQVEEKIAKSFTMDVKNATKKDYIDGETLNNFDGVTVTVTYTDRTEKTFKGDEIKTLKLNIHPFAYGEKNIIVEYGDLLAKVDVSYLNIQPKSVVKIEAVSTNVTKTYAVGDKLDLTGLQIRLTWNDGKTSTISYSDPKVDCSPAHGSAVTASTKKVMILYTGEDGSQLATSFSLTVTSDKKILSADLAYGSTGKTEYFIGETFSKSGFRVTLFYNDNTKETLALDSSYLTVTYKLSDGTTSSTAPSFTSAQSGNITLVISRSGVRNSTAELPIFVSVTKRPTLKDISVYAKKTEYLAGESPMLQDFVITARYDDGSTREFTVADDDTNAEKTSITTSKDGVTYTVKLMPSEIASETKSIKVTYTEKVTTGTTSTKTVEADVDIKVNIPDCILTTYTKTSYSRYTYKKIPYESFLEALEDAVDGDEIELCRDVTMTADYPSKKSLEIDLAGYTLTMVRAELYVYTNASSSTAITFTNSSRTDAHIRYTTDEDEDVIIAYNKEYKIDRTSSGDGRYEVKITTPKNGKVTGPEEVIHGHDAKFIITPNDGYEIATIKVNSKTYTIPSDNTLLIEDVKEKLTVTVTFQEKAWDNPFTDISKYATYYKSVQFVYEEGLFQGTSKTKFEPDTTMTRAMFVTVLGRLAGVNVDNYTTTSFTDVEAGQWYSEYVEWASSIGLVEGYGNGKFGPNDPITHAQMYVLMERYADIIEGMSTSAYGATISANDVRDIPDWAYDAVEYAAENDFLVVSSYKLTPNDNAKRSELAMLLQKFCTNILGME